MPWPFTVIESAIDDVSTEEWRPVVGFEGLYEISSEGKLRNSRGMAIGHDRPDGYRAVLLCKPNMQRTHKLIHSIVAEAFIGPRPGGMDVNHIDGNRSNNRASNLEYATRSENVLHSFRVLKRKGRLMSGIKQMTPDHVRTIRRLRREHYSLAAISKEVGFTVSAISMVINGNTWSRVKDCPPQPGLMSLVITGRS